MSDNQQISPLGTRIRHQRKFSGLTIKQVATLAGCSESLISKMENGVASPSLSMLHKVAKAIGTNVSELTADEWSKQSPVLRNGERQIHSFDEDSTDSKIRLERLSHLYKGSLMQADIHIIGPGASSEEIEHPGEEIGYVLTGTLELSIDGEHYKLHAGDSFHFQSDSPHAFRNISDEETKVLWVNTPTTF